MLHIDFNTKTTETSCYASPINSTVFGCNYAHFVYYRCNIYCIGLVSLLFYVFLMSLSCKELLGSHSCHYVNIAVSVYCEVGGDLSASLITCRQLMSF